MSTAHSRNMTAALIDAPTLPEPALAKSTRTRRSRGDGRSGGSLFAHGEPMIWLSGGALALCLAMIIGLMGLVIVKGASTFWPDPVVKIQLLDGKQYMGEPSGTESYTLTGPMYIGLPTAIRNNLRPQFLQALKLDGKDELDTFRGLIQSLPEHSSKALNAAMNAEFPQNPDLLPRITAMLDQLDTDPTKRAQVAQALTLAGKELHELTDHLIAANPAAKIIAQRTLYRTGNFELMDEHFHWISDFALESSEIPEWAIAFERETNGRFFGTPVAFLQVRPWSKDDDLEKLKAQDPQTQVLVGLFQNKAHDRKRIADVKDAGEIVYVVQKSWDDTQKAWDEFKARLGESHKRAAEKKSLEKHQIGELRLEQDDARIDVINAKLKYGVDSKEMEEAQNRYLEVVADVKTRTDVILKQITQLDALNREYGLLVKTAEGRTKHIEMADVVRAYPANQLGLGAKLSVYGSRWGEFFFSDPREANSEGGVFPAIYGTVVMTLVMSLAVVPFGVLAALYLREYAKPGLVVSAIRIAVNNLAGVPSIVFGVFGLGFFCYIIGKYIDGGPSKGLGATPWIKWQWLLGLAAWMGIVVAAIVVGLKSAGTKVGDAHARQKTLGIIAMILWAIAAVAGIVLLVYTPYFTGFFRAKLEDNKPTYGTGGLMWSSFTLALLTLPVVIVATEEALSAVPRSMREGSYACGASKWQTIKRIVLPRAMPGIMTGTILAMARGAGEVAPLMLVGVVKLAQELPIDSAFPFVHPERSFMHLGFHIYDVGFQSPNSKAAVPLVFTTTLLLILIIATLNIVAIMLRSKLRRKFVSGHF